MASKEQNDLYDNIQRLFQESNLTLDQFVVMLMQVISDLIENRYD